MIAYLRNRAAGRIRRWKGGAKLPVDPPPIRVRTRADFEHTLGDLFRTGRPIEAPSLAALAAWDVDLEDEAGGFEREDV